jgi:hypothetical protein
VIPLSESAPVRWSAPAEGRFDCRIWGDDAVVYVLASATTHALSPGASAILATLLEQDLPLGSDQLLARMGIADCDDDASDPAADSQVLQQLLVELEGLGIAQRHIP